MSLPTLVFIGLATSACAGSGFMAKTDAEAQQEKHRVANAAEAHGESHMGAHVAIMKSNAHAKLAYFIDTEEGKKEHERAVKMEQKEYLKLAAEELEWLSDVARDGFMDYGNGYKFPLLDTNSPLGKLPKGLPEIPTDPKKREMFMETLPVDSGTYNTMLALKKNPSLLVEVAQDEFKSKLASLVQVKDEVKPAESLIQQTSEIHQSSLEIIRASPKAFKSALKAWEKMVPQAASMLLQTEMAESPQEAKDVFIEAKELANRATALHQVVFDSVDKIVNKDKLMSVAQNRITSLLMRQSEATLSDFDALDGCTGQASDYSGAEARCLCVVDNICSKAGHAQSGDYCSIVSGATCMSPKNEKEASEMSTV